MLIPKQIFSTYFAFIENRGSPSRALSTTRDLSICGWSIAPSCRRAEFETSLNHIGQNGAPKYFIREYVNRLLQPRICAASPPTFFAEAARLRPAADKSGPEFGSMMGVKCIGEHASLPLPTSVVDPKFELMLLLLASLTSKEIAVWTAAQ